MNKLLYPLAAAGLFCGISTTFGAETFKKPNIIVILVDDMGFSDIGCYGSEIPTPNLDALAASGLRFTQFYNTSRCCPSRASLLTGLYSHQTGIGNMVADEGQPGYRGFLNNNCVTIAEVLKPAGYFTALAGKWHVGQDAGVTPANRGFDRSLNAPAGGFYYSDDKSPKAKLYLNGKFIENNDPQLPEHWYTTDLWTTFGLKFIDEALAAKKPFYLHLCHNAPHFPLQAPAGDIAKFRGKYKQGWDQMRIARHTKQIELGIVKESWPVSLRTEQIVEWDKLSVEGKDRFDYLMAVYAATVFHMDQSVGDLVAGLKKRGVYENTVILFMSDNGGNAESGPDGKDTGNPVTANSTWYCGESWAFLENTPFRKYKHFTHEGGVATPLIVHWPAGIAAKGVLRAQVGHVIDIMPTCIDLSGAKYPKQFTENAIQPMEGKSLVPAFSNKPVVREALYWEHAKNAAVRVGDLKLVRTGLNTPWELYDLSNDRTEQNDLASQRPEVTRKLEAMWEAWSVRAHVVPYPEIKKSKQNN